ncbi:hypothetical protein ACLMJK_002521 [Lecanora helva]
MSASRNADAVGNQPGEFGSRVGRDEPTTTHGHQPGKLVGNDAVPEFSAKTLPSGSAPADRTFEPNTTSEVPGQALNDLNDRSHGKESTKTIASSTLGGATSGDVHTGLGHPGSGQSSRELRHERDNPGGSGAGLAGVGASAASGNQMVDERMQPEQRGIEKEGGQYADTRSSKREPQPEGEI